jgi:hypothetical protein
MTADRFNLNEKCSKFEEPRLADILRAGAISAIQFTQRGNAHSGTSGA